MGGEKARIRQLLQDVRSRDLAHLLPGEKRIEALDVASRIDGPRLALDHQGEDPLRRDPESLRRPEVHAAPYRAQRFDERFVSVRLRAVHFPLQPCAGPFGIVQQVARTEQGLEQEFDVVPVGTFRTLRSFVRQEP
ncbi:MAG: hypothetical protein IJH78_01795 [Clostridia bacterium]|nr:hypothetical protein [Clostridia bacterium]